MNPFSKKRCICLDVGTHGLNQADNYSIRGSDEETDNPGTTDDEYSKLSREELEARLRKTKKQVDDKEKYIQSR